MKFKRISVDTSKSVFTLHGIDEQDERTLRRDLRRSQFEAFFAKLAPTEVAMEACGGSHHWARRLASFGHQIRLIPPQYVKPFVKRGKNDRNDAEAISEAASRPAMRTVPVKSAEQQSQMMVPRVRELLVRQRTQQVNALRGHAAEFGIVAPKGIARVDTLLAMVASNPQLPPEAREMLQFLGRQIARQDEELAAINAKLKKLHKANAVSQLLEAVPGIGALSAITLTLAVDPAQFKSGRHLAAWLGLTPKERSTGGKHQTGGISRAGNERLRQLLVVGAMAVVRHASQGSKSASPWLLKLLERRPSRKLVAVALANKMARIVWAMMTSGEEYRRQPINP